MAEFGDGSRRPRPRAASATERAQRERERDGRGEFCWLAGWRASASIQSALVCLGGRASEQRRGARVVTIVGDEARLEAQPADGLRGLHAAQVE